MKTDFEVLKLLAKSNSYMSGESISKTLNLSRTSVWKAVNKLRKSGYVIDSVTNKGYILLNQPDIISECEISSKLCYKSNVYVFDELCSTNTYAKSKEHCDGDIIVTGNQTAGRGRMGRAWVSGTSPLAMTIYIKPDIALDKVMNISLIFGVAVCNAINELTNINAKIKWPNDIVVDGKKLCGILTEAVTQDNCIECVVCGVGINVNDRGFSDELKNKATSLYMLTNIEYKRNDIIVSIANHFYYMISQGFDIPHEFKSLCINIGKEVYISRGKKKYIATAIDISKTGGLIVKTADGTVSEVTAGEVSVRGVYGYV